MNRKRFIILISFIALSAIGYLFLKHSFRYLSGYLSKSEQVNANVLIMEGWLPDYSIEKIYNEYRQNNYQYIITTGLSATSGYYMLSMNGFLIFYPGNRFAAVQDSDRHLIEVSAASSLGGDNRAHFNVYVNDSLVSEFLAEKKKKTFPVHWNGNLKKVDSISVQFDNDKVGDFGDRNLYINDITVDHKITIPYLNNSVYQLTGQHGKRRIRNNFSSFADLARNRLISTGIDPSKIISVPAKRVRINRTLTSALAVRDWLSKSDIRVEGINIVSEGTHARRTWMTYNKVLKGSYKIGIISLPDYNYNYSRERKLLSTVRQAVAIVYYWFILLPY